MTRMRPSNRMQPAFQIFPELLGAPPGRPKASLGGRADREETNHSSPGVGQEMRIGWPPPRGRGFLGELADAAQALQYFAERLLGLVLVKNEEHLFEA